MKPASVGFLIAIALLLCNIPTAAQVAAVKFTAIVPQPDSQSNSHVFLAGSFNGWNSHDSLYIMTRESDNTYSLWVPLFDGKPYKYKYTRGNWSSVETKPDDSDIADRQFYAKNGATLYDTVMKWKTPAVQKPSSPQMQKLMGMRDSLKARLQATLNRLLVVLKEYNEVMLSSKPNERKHKKLNKQALGMWGDMYKTIESKVWAVGTSLSPEQKQKILAALRDPNASKDLLSALGKAYGAAMQ